MLDPMCRRHVAVCRRRRRRHVAEPQHQSTSATGRHGHRRKADTWCEIHLSKVESAQHLSTGFGKLQPPQLMVFERTMRLEMIAL